MSYRLLFLVGLLALGVLPGVVQAQAPTSCEETGGDCMSAAECKDQGRLGAKAPRLCPDTDLPVCCLPYLEPVQATPNAGTESGQSSPDSSEGAATGQTIPEGYGLKNPLGPRTIPQIIGGIVQWMGGLAGSMFFLYLVWGGAQWMTARGSEEQAQTGRKKIIAATAGIVVVLTAYLMVSAVIGLVPR